MKKGILFVFAMTAILALTLAGCGKKEKASEIEKDLGSSEIYSEEDRNAAIDTFMKEFDGWEGCEMHSIRYAGDACSSEENVAWMNELGEGKTFTQCIEFITDFHSPKEGGGAWEPDQEYTDYQWYLAREEGGGWELMTWGY